MNNKLLDPNTEFCHIKIPRFGFVRCIKSTRTIAKGEELFIDYGYDVEDDSVPKWYKELYVQVYGNVTASEDDEAAEPEPEVRGQCQGNGDGCVESEDHTEEDII